METAASVPPSYPNDVQVELTRESKELEHRLTECTHEMNCYPLKVCFETWHRNLEAVEEQCELVCEYARYLSGDDMFRANSPADCADAISRRGFPVRVNEKGNPITDKDTLAELAGWGCELASTILDARSLISKRSQLRAWGKLALQSYVQPHWNSLGTPMGRYTSESPCLNNRILEIRETIEVPKGYVLLSLDLGQAEYVTWASLSGDPVLSAAFKEGRDLHVETATLVKREVPDWTFCGMTERDAGKMLNFAILYQMKVPTLARKLGCSVETAQKVVDAYYRRTQRAKTYTDDVLTRAEHFGFTETAFGRRRHCPEYRRPNCPRDRHELEKSLFHHHNCGSAAEVLKFKQLAAWEFLREYGFTPDLVRLVIQLYDECVWLVRSDVLAEVRDVLLGIWRKPETGFLPFAVDVRAGFNWREVSK